LTSIMAIGSVTGALLAARREKPRAELLVGGAALFGVGFIFAALMPNYWAFGGTLVVIGIAAQTFTTSVVGTTQLATEPAMRGRVMAILLAIAMGSSPVGAPIVGWVADRFGPRWALVVGAASGLVAAAFGLHYLIRHRGLRLSRDSGRLAFRLNEPA
jgi:MFS family permease